MTEPLPTDSREQPQSVRLRWIVYVGMLCGIAFCIGIVELLPIGARNGPITWTTYSILWGLAVWAIVGARQGLRQMLRIATSDPSCAEKMQHNRFMLLMKIGTSVVLYGVVARLLGGNALHALPFYFTGTLLVATAPPNHAEISNPLI